MGNKPSIFCISLAGDSIEQFIFLNFKRHLYQFKRFCCLRNIVALRKFLQCRIYMLRKADINAAFCGGHIK